jgi:hypothetical protein
MEQGHKNHKLRKKNRIHGGKHMLLKIRKLKLKDKKKLERGLTVEEVMLILTVG